MAEDFNGVSADIDQEKKGFSRGTGTGFKL